jgi:hypothetical protein
VKKSSTGTDVGDWCLGEDFEDVGGLREWLAEEEC